MSKTKKLFLAVAAIAIITPSIALAAWRNPLSWFNQALKEKDENECYKEGDLFFNKIEHLEGSDTATHRIFYFPNKTN